MKKTECKYCNFTNIGDIPTNRKCVVNLPFGKIGYTRIALEGDICGSEDPYLFFSLYGKDESNITAIGSVKINYCPMCGRRL